MHTDSQIVTLVFTVVTGVGVLLQAAVLLGMFLALRKTQKKLHGLTERIEDVLLPVLSSSRGVIEDISPKIKVITTNLVGASDTLRKQAENVGTVVEDMSARTRQQSARVDKMISGTLDNIGEATAAVERGVSAPLRKISGILAGLRAGVDTLRTNSAPSAAVRRKPAAPPPAPPYASRSVIEPDTIHPNITPEEAREAAARFVRDRAAAGKL